MSRGGLSGARTGKPAQPAQLCIVGLFLVHAAGVHWSQSARPFEWDPRRQYDMQHSRSAALGKAPHNVLAGIVTMAAFEQGMPMLCTHYGPRGVGVMHFFFMAARQAGSEVESVSSVPHEYRRERQQDGRWAPCALTSWVSQRSSVLPFLTARQYLSDGEGRLAVEQGGCGRCCMHNLFQAGAVVSCAGQAR